MCSLYERLKSLCEQRGITGYKMCKDCDVQPSIVTDLKMGRRKGLRADTAARIAAYFGVTVDYLLGNDDSPAQDQTPAHVDALVKNALFAAYGEVKDQLDEADLDDIALFMRMKAARKKEKPDHSGPGKD